MNNRNNIAAPLTCERALAFFFVCLLVLFHFHSSVLFDVIINAALPFCAFVLQLFVCSSSFLYTTTDLTFCLLLFVYFFAVFLLLLFLLLFV